MSYFPENLKYAQSHEWVRVEQGNIITVGITDHAQTELGDLVFVELPEVGATFSQGDEAGVVESVKTASDIYSPASGKITAVNEILEDAPETINNNAFGEGWIFQMEVNDPSEIDAMLNAQEYQSQVASDDQD